MIDIEREVRGEGNCVRVTGGGKEACRCMGMRRVCLAPPRCNLVQVARLRIETGCKAGVVRRVSTTLRTRPQSTAQVNGEHVQRNITFISGETCIGGTRAVVVPASKACLKSRERSGESRTVFGSAAKLDHRGYADNHPIFN